ncbi:MAG: hypothetical protein DMG24_07030, partial [Acidobacteria bacterium]
MIAQVPTADERNGDFSDLCPGGFDASGLCPQPPEVQQSHGAQVVDPATGIPFLRNQVPVGMFSAPSQFFLQYIPLPNGPGHQLTFAGPSVVQNDDQWLAKSDWIHGKHQLSGSFFWTRFNEPPDIASAKRNILAADGNGNAVTVKNLSLNHTYSLSPTLLFNTWFCWDSQTGGSLSGAPFG